MLSRKLFDDKNLILWNSKYYVVNNFTYKLLDMFDKQYDIRKISKLVGYSRREVKLLYNTIEKKLLSKDYYEDNLNLKTPIKIQWKITNKCNLHCKHCYLGKLDGMKLPYERVMKIVDIIVDSNVMEVTLSGGECLTYKGIENVIIRLLNQGIKVDIFTNALLLDKLIDKLENENVKKDNILFYVSVDGLKNSHEKIRGKNTFNKTFENIKYATSFGYSVTTNTVINNINYNDIVDMIVLLKNAGVKDVQISNLLVQGSATKDLEISLDKQIELKSRLSELYHDHPEYGYIYYSEVPDSDGVRKVYSLSSEEDKYIGTDNWTCTAGVARVTINPDGKVYCCPFIKDSYLGDLNDESLDNIWYNTNRFKFLKRLSQENKSRVCLAMKEGRK